MLLAAEGQTLSALNGHPPRWTLRGRVEGGGLGRGCREKIRKIAARSLPRPPLAGFSIFSLEWLHRRRIREAVDIALVPVPNTDGKKGAMIGGGDGSNGWVLIGDGDGGVVVCGW